MTAASGPVSSYASIMHSAQGGRSAGELPDCIPTAPMITGLTVDAGVVLFPRTAVHYNLHVMALERMICVLCLDCMGRVLCLEPCGVSAAAFLRTVDSVPLR